MALGELAGLRVPPAGRCILTSTRSGRAKVGVSAPGVEGVNTQRHSCPTVSSASSLVGMRWAGVKAYGAPCTPTCAPTLRFLGKNVAISMPSDDARVDRVFRGRHSSCFSQPSSCDRGTWDTDYSLSPLPVRTAQVSAYGRASSLQES